MGKAADEIGWRRYRRTGRVTARRLDAPRRWLTEAGDTMTAQAGDWWLTDTVPRSDGSPRSWSIGDRQFAAAYRLADDTGPEPIFQRNGEMAARPARPGEIVYSREGQETARAGDWIACDDDGDWWIVPADHFRRVYTLITVAAAG